MVVMWIIALAVAGIFFGWVRMFAWQRTKESPDFRWFVCAVLALCLTPSAPLNDGHGGLIVLPAIFSFLMVTVLELVCARGELYLPYVSVIIISAVSILVAWCALIAIWSLKLRKKAEATDPDPGSPEEPR